MTGGTSQRLNAAAELYSKIRPEYEHDPDIFCPDAPRVRRLKEAIERLPEGDKVIIRLYAELESLSAVAELLGVGKTAVWKDVRRIRETILKDLNKR